MRYPQHALYNRFGRTEDALFLEKFRYIIVASQLLNEYSNPATYKRQKFPQPATDDSSLWKSQQNLAASPQGLIITSIAAFSCAWSIRWLYSRGVTSCSRWIIISVTMTLTILTVVLYYCFRRQWLQYLRTQAMEAASLLTNSSQDLDSAASAGITLIQEVELVSRGYNMSVSPDIGILSVLTC